MVRRISCKSFLRERDLMRLGNRKPFIRITSFRLALNAIQQGARERERQATQLKKERF
jgi:hypothetical protein